MITTYSGRIASIGEAKIINTQTGQLPVIDFQLAIDRGNTKKRTSLLTGKEYDSDFYKVSIVGQSAISFFNNAQKGRRVAVSGRMIQEEFISKMQPVMITPQNPMYAIMSQIPNIQKDGAGNLFLQADHPVSRTVIQSMEYRWEDANPNKQQGFAGFNASGGAFGQQQGFGQTGNNGFNQQQSPFNQQQTPAFGKQTQGFGQMNNSGFNANPQVQGFGAPQQLDAQVQGFGNQIEGFGVQANAQTPTGFGALTQGQGFGQQQTFSPAPQTQAQQFPGFGTQSNVPNDFNPAQFTPVGTPTSGVIVNPNQQQQVVATQQQPVVQEQANVISEQAEKQLTQEVASAEQTNVQVDASQANTGTDPNKAF